MQNRLKPAAVPPGITVTAKAGKIIVKNDQAELRLTLPQSGNAAADAGTQRSLTANAIIGLTSGFSKTLEIVGTGYRAAPKDKGLELSLGYSHQIYFEAPEGVSLSVKDNRFIIVSGADKALVGQAAADIRQLRRPDAYKGKGIRYLGEILKLKPGKAAKTGTEG